MGQGEGGFMGEGDFMDQGKENTYFVLHLFCLIDDLDSLKEF